MGDHQRYILTKYDWSKVWYLWDREDKKCLSHGTDPGKLITDYLEKEGKSG